MAAERVQTDNIHEWGRPVAKNKKIVDTLVDRGQSLNNNHLAKENTSLIHKQLEVQTYSSYYYTGRNCSWAPPTNTCIKWWFSLQGTHSSLMRSHLYLLQAPKALEISTGLEKQGALGGTLRLSGEL